MSNRIAVIQGDITKFKVDAIVNPCNNSLEKGFGVYKKIHRLAGPGLLEECSQIKGCAIGEAKITGGYDLLAKWVIHTLGPIWLGGKYGEAEQLANCYSNCLTLAEQNDDIRTIAVPPLSIGVYHYPLKKASNIAVTEIKNFLDNNTSIEQVIIVCKGKRTRERFAFVVERMTGKPPEDLKVEMIEPTPAESLIES